MYCPQCDLNWRFIPGKRYFRTEPATVREKPMRCPECTEEPREKQQRLMVNARSNGLTARGRGVNKFFRERLVLAQ